MLAREFLRNYIILEFARDGSTLENSKNWDGLKKTRRSKSNAICPARRFPTTIGV